MYNCFRWILEDPTCLLVFSFPVLIFSLLLDDICYVKYLLNIANFYMCAKVTVCNTQM